MIFFVFQSFEAESMSSCFYSNPNSVTGGPASNASMMSSHGSASPPAQGGCSGTNMSSNLNSSSVFHHPSPFGGSLTSGHYSSADDDSDASVENNLVAHGGGNGGSNNDNEQQGLDAVVRVLSLHPAVQAAIDANGSNSSNGQSAPNVGSDPAAVAVDEVDLSLFDQ